MQEKSSKTTFAEDISDRAAKLEELAIDCPLHPPEPQSERKSMCTHCLKLTWVAYMLETIGDDVALQVEAEAAQASVAPPAAVAEPIEHLPSRGT